MKRRTWAVKKSEVSAELSKKRSAAGKLGAAKLNGDPVKKSAAARKATDTRLKQNPNFFRIIGHLGGSAEKKKLSDLTLIKIRGIK
jgi:hypothetical protein